MTVKICRCAATVKVRKLYFVTPPAGGSRAGVYAHIVSFLGNQGGFFMGKKIVSLFILAVLGLYSLSIISSSVTKNTETKVSTIGSTSPTSTKSTEVVSYPGEDGKDALHLLQEKTPVSQDQSGLVVSINGRQAESKKHEYWAFYINGKMSQVGPKEYITKDVDMIEWKIETY